MKLIYTFTLFIIFCSCQEKQEATPITIQNKTQSLQIKKTALIILGTTQDAGSPHIACQKECCKSLFTLPDENRKVVSLGIIDPENKKKYLFEATPDITKQIKALKEFDSIDSKETPDGIFLTHAHIGHYTGLMYFGKEAMNAKNIPVYAMPLMRNFLKSNGPWSQLVANQNILLHGLAHEKTVELTSNLQVTPFTVPHRDEYSETVGYTISGPNRSVLFIPDIDKWEKWDKNIITEISKVDFAFIDATFYDGEEINNRDISEIPHPFIIESMALFESLSAKEKKKIFFIHFNHTNPALDRKSAQTQLILKNGFNIAKVNQIFDL